MVQVLEVNVVFLTNDLDTFPTCHLYFLVMQ